MWEREGGVAGEGPAWPGAFTTVSRARSSWVSPRMSPRCSELGRTENPAAPCTLPVECTLTRILATPIPLWGSFPV